MAVEILVTDDGAHTLKSHTYGVTYHSIHGALQETEVVFLEAGLECIAEQKKEISILEIGMGTGLNALMTYKRALEKSYAINYVALEAYPISEESMQELNYPELLGLDRSVFEALHANEEGKRALTDHFDFERRVMLFEDLDDEDAYDVIYYDAFAPNAQPELWKEPILGQMYKALKQGGVLVTYCAQGAFKRALKAVGFRVEPLPGPKRKREMTRAVKD